MAGELCRYAVTSSDPDDNGEEDIVHTATVPSRIIQTSESALLSSLGCLPHLNLDPSPSVWFIQVSHWT
jgi:hypothetical protein